MTIHWLWIPLILTSFFGIVGWIADGFKSEVNSGVGFFCALIGGLCAIVSIFIYAITGFIWVCNNVTITT